MSVQSGAARQREPEGAALTRHTFDADLTAELLGDPPHDGEAQAMAVTARRLQAGEFGEQARPRFWRQSHAVIAHPKAHKGIVLCRRIES